MSSICSTIDYSVDKFYELLKLGLDQFVPILWLNSSNHFPWYTKDIINLKNRRNRAHKKFAKPSQPIDERESKIHLTQQRVPEIVFSDL